MGLIQETIINRFDGGMTNSIRDSIEAINGNLIVTKPTSRILKHFDILTAKNKMLPHSDDQADSTGDTEQLCLFLTYGVTTKQYTLGIVGSGSSRPKIFERASLPQGVWGASTGGNATAGGARSEQVFVAYTLGAGGDDVIYGLSGGDSIWQYDITTNTFTNQHTAITYTSAAQGLVHSKDDILYIPYNNNNGSFIASKNGANAFNTTALTLPRNTIITAICEYGNYLAIAVRPKAQVGGRSVVYLWDRNSSLATLSEKIDWGTEDLMFIEEVDGFLVGVSVFANTSIVKTPKILIKYVSGSGTKKITEFNATNITVKFGNNTQKANGRLYFMMNVEIDNMVYMGVWSLGLKDGLFAYCLEYILNNGATTFTASDSPLGFQFLGDYLTVTYKVGNTYVIRMSNIAVYTTTNSTYESLIFNSGNSSLIKDLIGITLMFEPLLSGGQCVLKYKKDSDSSWSSIFTFNTQNAISYSINSGSGLLPKEYKELQFQILSTGNAKLTGLHFAEDITGKRVY